MRIQKPNKTRRRMHLAAVREIRKRIEEIAAEHEVSRNWVINVILAKALHIKEQEQFD